MIIQENYSLIILNTFGIDVNAKFFVEIQHVEDLKEYLQSTDIKSLPVLILGGGSNILFTKDFPGIVIKPSFKGIKIIEENEKDVLLEAMAGEIWDDLVSYCVQNGFYGIENLSMIPGTVGAAPIQNIGAYGVELKDVLASLEGYLIETGEKKIFTNSECGFDYRDSIFRHDYKRKIIITKVVLRLSKVKKFNLTYREMNDKLSNRDFNSLTLADVRETVINIRRSKLPDPSRLGNAGSFFNNPEIKEKEFSKLHRRFPDLVYFKINKNVFKISAGWLIEKCGYKGKRIGNVGSYERQALVIVNYGKANGEEIKKYADNIRQSVYKKFGIKLNFEVNII